jgi:hypothetical protein
MDNVAAPKSTRGSVMAGEFERDHNILHIWFPEPLNLATREQVERFFSDAQREWIDPTPGPFYLLVNYTNLTIDPAVTEAYAKAIKKFQHKLLGTFRYRVTDQLTATAVRLGNMRMSKASRIYASESEAREAIRKTK